MAVTGATWRAFAVALVFFSLVYAAFIAVVMMGAPAYVASLEDNMAYEVVQVSVEEPSEDLAIDFDVEGDNAEAESDAKAPLSPSADVVAIADPRPDLIEDHSLGALPIRSKASGVTPFQYYRAAFDVSAIDGPVVALAIMDYGLSDRLSQAAVQKLPAAVSLLLSPYATEADHWQNQARRYGHEMWLQASFQTAGYPQDDAGSYAILKRSSLRYNLDQLYRLMGRAQGYVGLVGELDSVLIGIDPLMQSIFGDVFSRGLGYLELGTSNEMIETTAAKYNAPYITDPVTINSVQDLQALSDKALKREKIVGVISPSPAVLDALPQWIERQNAQGVTVVPLSALYRL